MKEQIKKLVAFVTSALMALALVPGIALADGGTITVENATYNKEYKAYKVFDATYSGDAVAYTVDAAHKGNVSTEFFNVSTSADSNGRYSVSKKDDVTDEQVIDWLKSNYTKFDSTGITGAFDTANAKVTFSNVAPGYYYITSTLGSAVTVDTAHPDATVKDKNASQPTTPEKKIVSVDGQEVTETTSADVHVGSTLGFKVTGNATNWTTSGSGNSVTYSKNTAYEFEDTYANINLPKDKSFYTVKVNGGQVTNFSVETDKAGTVKFSIPLVDENGNFLYSANGDQSAYIPVEITYTGTVTAGAADAVATNKAGNDTDNAYTYKFQLSKVDQDHKPLKGAKFQLSKQGETTPLKFTDNNDGSYTYDPTNGTVTDLSVNNDGASIVVKGLDKSWNYTLHESVVPAGYNTSEDQTVEGSNLARVDADASTAAVTVTNRKGGTLPTTGGMGTTLFTVVGAALVVAAGVLLVTRRRMQQ